MSHAQLSPSSAVRWMTCPGSVALCKDLPDTSSVYADEGTDAHELAATCLTTGAKAGAFVGNVLAEGNQVTSDMATHVQRYVQYVQDIADSGDLFVEQELDISSITGEAEAHGTSDAVVIQGDEIIVVDLKYGMGEPVQADNNPQLMIYALAALREFGVVQDFKSVRLVIHQPRLNSVSEWTLTVDELEAFGEKVWSAALDTRQDDAPLTPSTKGCRWCKAKATCPALRQQVLDGFDALPTDAIATAAPCTIATALAKVDLIEGWCTAVRTKAFDDLMAGVAVPGFKLVQGKRGNRAWKSEAEAEAALKAMRVKHDVMYSYKVISPTAAQKLADAEIIGKRQWPKLQALITQAEGKPSVAPESDKRPALVLDNSADFADLTLTPVL